VTKQELRGLLKDALQWKIYLFPEDLDKWEELVPPWLKELEDQNLAEVCIREYEPYLDVDMYDRRELVWGILHAVVPTDSLNYTPVSEDEVLRQSRELQASHGQCHSLRDELWRRYNDAPRLREALRWLLECVDHYPNGGPFLHDARGALIQARQTLEDIPPYPLTVLNQPENQ
jgi:DNA-binding transcriptional LysR family regulator